MNSKQNLTFDDISGSVNIYFIIKRLDKLNKKDIFRQVKTL